MVKKQSAYKTSGKSSSVAGASSQTSKKTTIAPSPISQEGAKFWGMECLAERGFRLSDANPSFTSTVHNLRWESFVKRRGSYCIPIVREFYAGIPEQKFGKPLYYSIIRGKRVNFDSKTINDEYLLGYNGTEFEKLVENAGKKEMDRIKSRIGESDAVWERCKATKYNMLSRYLRPEVQAWNLFIACSLFPTSHTFYQKGKNDCC